MGYLKDTLGDKYKDGMTVDEIDSLLGSMKQSKSDDVAHLKDLLSRANSEAADYKKQLKEKMSAEEKAEAERKEQAEKIQQELDSLRKEKKVSEYRASLLSLGYDDESASGVAMAFADGDIATAISGQKKFLENYKKAVIADAMKNTAKPNREGSTEHTMTLSDFRKLNVSERVKYAQENPEQYKEMYSNYDNRGK